MSPFLSTGCVLGASHVPFILMDSIKNRNISEETIIAYGFGRKGIVCNSSLRRWVQLTLLRRKQYFRNHSTDRTVLCLPIYTSVSPSPQTGKQRNLSAPHCVSVTTLPGT